jgi:hypothetical protein
MGKALLTPMDLKVVIDSLNKFKENTSPLELSKLFSSTSSGTIYMPLDFMDNFIAYLTERHDSGETVMDLPKLNDEYWTWKGCEVDLNDRQFKIILESIKPILDDPASSEYVKHLCRYLDGCDRLNSKSVPLNKDKLNAMKISAVRFHFDKKITDSK